MNDEGTGTKTVYRFEMACPEDLRPARSPDPEARVRRVEIPCPEFNWFLHQAVGSAYRWGGHDDWGVAEWTEYVDLPGFETWVAYVSGAPAGYFELAALADASVRIHCFGLLPRFVGRGLGGYLLTVAVERGWALTSTRVWLETCSHDHQHARPNYLARGFRLVGERTEPANRPREPVLFRSG